MITSVLSSKRLVDFSMPIMKRLVASKSAVLSCDRNPALRFIMRKVIYDHFAAGECKDEVRRTVATMKHMGFKGVILGHAKDVVVNHNAQNESAAIKDGIGDAFDPAVEKWKEGQLETLRMLTGDDILAIKSVQCRLDPLEPRTYQHIQLQIHRRRPSSYRSTDIRRPTTTSDAARPDGDLRSSHPPRHTHMD